MGIGITIKLLTVLSFSFTALLITETTLYPCQDIAIKLKLLKGTIQE